jgi:hypothetical protein
MKSKYRRIKYPPPEAHLRGSVDASGSEPGWEVDRDDYAEFVALQREFFANNCRGVRNLSDEQLKRFSTLARRICFGLKD